MTFRLPTALRDHDDARCLTALQKYFHGSAGREAFMGRHFDTWGTRVDNAYTSDDVVAVAFLSVDVPSEAVLQLIADPPASLTDALSHPDCADRDLVEVDVDDITPEWAPWKLYTHVRALPGVGPTTASKLLARKRPRLLPIWDTVAGTVIGSSEGLWQGLTAALQANDRELHQRLFRLHREAELPDQVSALRVFDVIAWMEGNGNG